METQSVMSINVRSVDPASDLTRIAELTNAVHPDSETEDLLREDLLRQIDGRFMRSLVASVPGEPVAGYALVDHAPWQPAGRFWGWVTTDGRWRGQGIGSTLYAHALTLATEQHATVLATQVRDDQPESLAFAERRNFHVERHIFESTIDLATFDGSRFAGLVKAVEATGIRFFTLADVGNTREALRALWEVNYRAVLDDPASTGNFSSFEDFSQVVGQASWFDPAGQIMAADVDTLVGLGAVGYFAETRSARNMITGVERAYRGRHIALALKLLGIRYAKAKGALTIRTNNDSQNAPMLAINRKLGYLPQPGILRLTKQLASNEAIRVIPSAAFTKKLSHDRGRTHHSARHLAVLPAKRYCRPLALCCVERLAHPSPFAPSPDILR